MFRFEDNEPDFLIVYTGNEHAEPEDYIHFVKHWVSKLEQGIPFGVILVSEPHPDHEHTEEHRQDEAEITRIINDFRRDYRDRTSQLNTGFVRIFTPEMVQEYMPTQELWDQGREANNRFAQYNWGIPGEGFTNLDDARNWLRGQKHGAGAAPEAVTSKPSAERVGLYYGSSTGITEYIAEEVQEAWEKAGMKPIEAVNITDVSDISVLLDYDCLILGIPTWNIGQLQDDWEIVFPQLDQLDFTGKKVAIFGIGDMRGYPDNFLDAVGILGKKLIERHAQLVGYWYDEHYKFRESLGFVDSKFMGLGIDDTNQSKLNSQRIDGWVAQLINEFALQPTAVS